MIGLAVFLICIGVVFLAVMGYLFVNTWREIREQEKLIALQVKLHRQQVKEFMRSK